MAVEYLQFFSSFNDLQLKIYESGHAALDNNWQGESINPSFSRLYYIVSGNPYIININSGKTKKELKPGFCYLLPYGTSIEFGCSTHMEQLYFHIAIYKKNSYDILRDCNGIIEFECGYEKIEELLNLTQSPCFHNGVMANALIWASLAKLFNTINFKPVQTEYSPCVELAINYIHNNPTIKTTLKEIAANAFVSQSTLSKKFRLQVGKSVNEYVDDIVFANAEQMLRSPALTVAEISEAFGFCDQFYFSRRFKQRYKQSPREYRQNLSI